VLLGIAQHKLSLDWILDQIAPRSGMN
jgi:hypothetical protein